MKIYTKTGDNGETSLLGGKRVKKSDPNIAAYGTCDELNSQLGICLNFLKSEELISDLSVIQNQLFICGSMLSVPKEKNDLFGKMKLISKNEVEFLEYKIDEYEKKLIEIKNFIMPGGSEGASFLHIARTICRRCEREIVTLNLENEVMKILGVYINRLSDYLFVAARYENFHNKIDDVLWKV